MAPGDAPVPASGDVALDARRTLEERVAALEHIEAIKRLKHRYWRACDRKDPATFRACFARRGASVRFAGLGAFDDADDLATVFERIALRRRGGRHVVLDMHHGLHPEITLTGEGRAVGLWSMRFRQLDLDQATERVAAIEYDDVYVVEDGRWRIERSHVRELWSLVTPLPEGRIVTEGL
jgi:hypothetical protein